MRIKNIFAKAGMKIDGVLDSRLRGNDVGVAGVLLVKFKSGSCFAG